MKPKNGEIACKFCGAHFDEMLPKCPYCESTNIKGAQAQYMERLEDVRSDMEGLAQIPVQETKKEIKKQTKFILIIEGKPVYEWGHSDYSSALAHYKDMEYVWAKIERGEPPMSVSEYAGLIVGYSFIEYYYNRLTEEEQERFALYYETAKADYEARWDFQGKEWEAVEKGREENYGIVPYETAEKYVEVWLERQGK